MKLPKNIDQVKELIEGMDDKQRYMAFGVVLLLIFTLDYVILMRPQLNMLWKIKPEIKTLQDNIKAANTELQRLPQYRSQVADLTKQLDDVNQKLKSRREIPVVLERISRIANGHNIKIGQIMPNIEDQEVMMDDKGRTFYTLPISIKAEGGYHDFGAFLNSIENDDIYLSLSTFSIDAQDGKKMSSILLTVTTIIYEEGKT